MVPESPKEHNTEPLVVPSRAEDSEKEIPKTPVIESIVVPVTKNAKKVYVDDGFFKDVTAEKIDFIFTEFVPPPSVLLLIHHNLFGSVPLHR